MSHLTLHVLIVQDGLIKGLVAALSGFAASRCTTTAATTYDVTTVCAKLQDFSPAKQVHITYVTTYKYNTPS